MYLGLIEGFYGPLWSWRERRALVDRLAAHGYSFWHYAPKADPGIRSDWHTPWSDDHVRALSDFAAYCRAAGLAFGIGLTPLGLRIDSAAADWDALAARLAVFDAIGADELLLGFDDVRGDTSDLARQQAAIVDWAAARTRATRVIVCPTYYSDDGLLDRLFGPRPPDYLGELGRALDPRIGVYWAGEQICPREIMPGAIERVADTLRRYPRLWDNYPVNDSAVMCQQLHLRAFTGRDPGLAGLLEAHAVNPALQPTLSAIPALTLAERYRRGDDYSYTAAFRRAAREVLGAKLAAQVENDLVLLQDTGRDRMTAGKNELRARYAAYDHPGAREIVAWLDGAYASSGEAPT